MAKKEKSKPISQMEIIPITPKEIKINDIEILQRDIFYDERGFLIETFAITKEKIKSVYSYVSLTQPGFARDNDKFHYHLKQKDRFTVILGEIWILLYDARKSSTTFGNLEVVSLKGGDSKIKQKTTLSSWTITVPQGIYHGIKNPNPFLAILVNHPTSEYNPQDEGRILFSQVSIPCLNGKSFSWEMVKK